MPVIRHVFRIFACMLLATGLSPAQTPTDSVPRKPLLVIKPETSFGYSTIHGGSFNWQVGGAVLIYANKTQRYGITANYIAIDHESVQYLSTGIVLEMVAFKYFYARVGTIGYFGLRNASHVFGLTSNIGFEYSWKYLQMSAGYKTDGMVTDGLPSQHNFYLQFGYRFDRKVSKK